MLWCWNDWFRLVLVPVLALVLSPPNRVYAHDDLVWRPIFDEAAARAFPQAIFDKIRSKIVRQTTFVQIGSEGPVRWSIRTLRLVDFIKVPSPTFPDTHLFAMRYEVSVISDLDSLAVHSTSCAVVIVYKDKAWHEPTVLCAPVNLDPPEPT
jgi:hypothetical protein